MKVQVVEGVFQGFANGVVSSSGANQLTKAINTYNYDYMELDGVRWKNITVSGSVNDKLKAMEGEKTKLHYIENMEDGTKKRMIVGFEDTSGQIEAVMPDDLKPTLKAVNTMFRMYSGITCMVWLLVGGFASGLLGFNTHPVLGGLTFVGGFAFVIWGFSKLRKSTTAPLAAAVEFAEIHDRSV